MISGGYVYGFGTAFGVNLVATVGGSQIAFLLARWAGRPMVEQGVSPKGAHLLPLGLYAARFPRRRDELRGWAEFSIQWPLFHRQPVWPVTGRRHAGGRRRHGCRLALRPGSRTSARGRQKLNNA